MTAALSVGSCSDWTKTEGLGYTRPTPAEADPAAYQEYLAAVREYKKSEHKVALVRVNGVETPARQNQHLITVPDSVDYIMVKGITELGPVMVDEMQKVRDEKGTKVFCVVDYNLILDSWNAMWEGTPDDPDAPDDRTPEEFGAYCDEQMKVQLSRFDKYGFDGIEISYLGPRSGTGKDAFVSNITTWRSAHSNAPMIFRGYWWSFGDEEILSSCRYIVAVPLNVIVAPTEMDGYIENNVRFVPEDARDRFIYEVVIPNVADPQKIGVTPQDAAVWANKPQPEDRFAKLGMSIDNAQDDYFDVAMIYKNIRQSIGIMAAGPAGPETPAE